MQVLPHSGRLLQALPHPQAWQGSMPVVAAQPVLLGRLVPLQVLEQGLEGSRYPSLRPRRRPAMRIFDRANPESAIHAFSWEEFIIYGQDVQGKSRGVRFHSCRSWQGQGIHSASWSRRWSKSNPSAFGLRDRGLRVVV